MSGPLLKLANGPSLHPTVVARWGAFDDEQKAAMVAITAAAFALGALYVRLDHLLDPAVRIRAGSRVGKIVETFKLALLFGACTQVVQTDVPSAQPKRLTWRYWCSPSPTRRRERRTAASLNGPALVLTFPLGSRRHGAPAASSASRDRRRCEHDGF